MLRAHKRGIWRWRTVMAAVVVLGLMAVIPMPVGAAQPGDTIELQIREAKTPAAHQALASRYEQEAQAAQQLASKHVMMREVYAAAHAMQQHDRPGEYHAFVAKRYQTMAKDYETLAAMHRMVAEQLK